MSLRRGERFGGFRDLRFGVNYLEEASSASTERPRNWKATLAARPRSCLGSRAPESQIDALYLPAGHKRYRQDEYREHRQVHDQVAESVLKPRDESYSSLYLVELAVQFGDLELLLVLPTEREQVLHSPYVVQDPGVQLASQLQLLLAQTPGQSLHQKRHADAGNNQEA